MAGVNPYITKVNATTATKPFTVTFIEEETGKQTLFMVDPAKVPFGRTGVAGSVYDIAEGAGLEIDHACGGVCACATCHVYITKGLGSCAKATEDEEDQLDTARAVTSESRLSCQCVPNGKEDLTVIIPKWNKNFAKEAHH